MEKEIVYIPGPQGPQGIQGDRGPKGIQGDRGPKGDTGKAPDMSDYYTKKDIDLIIGSIYKSLNEILS